ncbi:MAG: hypothetical protein WC554_14515 [Clostridia bacterium]
MLTRIPASQEQIDAIYRKHIKLPVFFANYSYDNEDNIGFVSCYSLLGAFIEFQVIRNQTTPMFFSIRPGGNNISYDVSYPKGKLLERLTEISNKARDHFWKGGQI